MPFLGEKLNFFSSGNLNRTDTWLDNKRYRDQLDWLGFGISERQDNTLNLNAKINYDFRDNIKFENKEAEIITLEQDVVIKDKEKLFKVFVYGTAFMALVCISQKIWGWQVSAGKSQVGVHLAWNV